MVFKPIVSHFLSSKLSAVCSDFSHLCFKPSVSAGLINVSLIVTALAEEARLILLVIFPALAITQTSYIWLGCPERMVGVPRISANGFFHSSTSSL